MKTARRNGMPRLTEGDGAKGSNRVQAGFAGTDADRILDVVDENFTISNAAGLSGILDRLNGLFDQVVGQNDFDLNLRQEVHDILGSPIELGMPLLPAETFGLRHRYALQADFLKGFLHLIQLEGFDYRFDFLHAGLFLPR